MPARETGLTTVYSIANPTGANSTVLPQGWYSLEMRGDTSDDSYNAPPSVAISQNSVTVGTLRTVIAGVAANVPGMPRMQPVEGFTGTIGLYSDGVTATVLTVTPGANGAMPKQISIVG